MLNFSSRIIYYYQTFIPITLYLFTDPFITHIHLSSIHFGNNTDGSPYIHLNDYPPDNKEFDEVWKNMELSNKSGIKNILMIGGAGGAFQVLFSDFEIYYKLLYNTIKKYPIAGVDLDIEEYVNINDVKKLINRIDKDFGKDFIISMAPVSYALQSNSSGMGNFSYKTLFNSSEGKRIDYFNGQFYGDYNYDSYKSVIDNGYPPDKINMGMLSGDIQSQNFTKICNTIKNLSRTYNNFGGVFVWEYIDSPPDPTYPLLWSYYMYKSIY